MPIIVNDSDYFEELKVEEIEYKPAVHKLVPVLLSLVFTVVMIVLNTSIEPSESGTTTAKIITAFIAGMFGYATLDFLRRSYFK